LLEGSKNYLNWKQKTGSNVISFGQNICLKGNFDFTATRAENKSTNHGLFSLKPVQKGNEFVD
jgi:hypothetical protein